MTDDGQLDDLEIRNLITPDQKRRIQLNLKKGMSLHEALCRTPVIDPLKVQIYIATYSSETPEEPGNADDPSVLASSERVRFQKQFQAEQEESLELKLQDNPLVKATEKMMEILMSFVALKGADFRMEKTDDGFVWSVRGADGKEWMNNPMTLKEGQRFLLQIMIAARMSPHSSELQEGFLVIVGSRSVPFLLRSENAKDQLYGFRLE